MTERDDERPARGGSRTRSSTVVEAVGLAATVAGLALWSIALALVVGGLLLVVAANADTLARALTPRRKP